MSWFAGSSRPPKLFARVTRLTSHPSSFGPCLCERARALFLSGTKVAWYDAGFRMRRSALPSASSFSFGPGPLSTALKALIGANVVMFVLTTLVQSLIPRLGLVPVLVLHQFRVWQLVTYMFLHGGFFHIIFNMLALWMFGAELERIWGTRFFLKFYFVTGIGAGLLTVLFSLMPFDFAQQLQQSI